MMILLIKGLIVVVLDKNMDNIDSVVVCFFVIWICIMVILIVIIMFVLMDCIMWNMMSYLKFGDSGVNNDVMKDIISLLRNIFFLLNKLLVFFMIGWVIVFVM